ncbi:MAG: tetratricopeptide repeat protein [Candidatus Riflebacteria bacterium]|nr:tetratricopeptide repeat protein [Candidatus Riflebacteria bacterium]
MRRLALAFLLFCPLVLWAQIELPGNGQVAALLDPARNLDLARKLSGAGDLRAAREHLTVALELSRVDSPGWAAAMLLALKDAPDLALSVLSLGEDAEVPLTLMPHPIEVPAGSPFTPPASYLKLEFLPPQKKRLLEFLLKTGQEVEATRVLEQTVEEEGAKPQLLLYLATVYERMAELPLAMQRYREAYDLVTLDEDRFAILYSQMRVLYRQGRFPEAGDVLKTYTALARAQVTQFVERVKSSPAGRDTMLSSLVVSRRHLVEVLNLQGLIKLEKKEERNAQLLLGQAELLAPGRLSIALNYNHVLGLGGHYETAAGNLSRIRQVLVAVSTEVQRLIDQSLNAGLKAPGGTFGRAQEALRKWLGVVAARQGVLLHDLRKLTAAARVLAEAISYTPQEPLPYYFLGLVEQEQKRLSEAQVNFRKALTNAETRDELARLAKAKVDQILDAQAEEMLGARSPEERAREAAGAELDVKKLRPLERGIEKGIALYHKKQWAEASALFLGLSQDFPRSADPPYYLGLVCQQRDDYEGALRWFEKSLSIAADFAPALSQMGFVLAEVGQDARDALRLAERAHTLAPKDPGVLSNLGWVRYYAGDSRGAIEALKESIEVAPKVPDPHLRLGLVFYRSALPQLALSKFQDVLAVEPANARAKVFAGLSLAKLGRARDALQLLSGVLTQFPPPGELNKVLVSTIASLRAGLEARGEPLDSLAATTAPLAVAAGTARPVTRKILAPAVTPQEARRDTAAAATLENAVVLVKSGRRDEARASLEKAVVQLPGNSTIAYPLALLMLEDGELDRARALLNSILDAGPLDLAALHSLGDVYFRQGRLLEYKDVLDRIVPVATGFTFSPFLDALAARWKDLLASGAPEPLAYQRLGLIRFHQYRFEEAVEFLDKVPAMPEAQVLRAQMHLHEYRRAKSEIEFQTARDLLTKAGYAHLDDLDRLWQAIKSPRLAEVEAQIERELARKIRAEVPKTVFSKRTIELTRRGEVDEMDLADSPILNRRWSQIDDKIDRTRVARTTYRQLQQPVLEDISLDPGRRFRQPGGTGRKAGPLPRAAVGAAEGLPGADATAPQSGPATLDAGAPAAPSPAGATPGSTATISPAGGANPAASGSPPPVVLPALTVLPEKQGLAERKLALGIGLAAQGRLLDAKGDFQTAIALDPGLERAHTALALTLLGLDEVDAARRTLDRADRIFTSELIRGQLAAWVALLQGDARRALAAWDPRPARSLSDFAYLEESEKIWLRMASDAPGDADAVYNLALIAYLKGDPAAALSRLRTVKDRTGRVGTLMAAAHLCEGIRGHARAGFQRGIDILRVAPMESLDAVVTALEAYARTHEWGER